MLDPRLHAVLRLPPDDVLAIDVALVDLEGRAVVDASLLPFGLGIESRPLETPGRVENQKPALDVQHAPESLEEELFLRVGEMAEEEPHECRVVRALRERMFENVAVNDRHSLVAIEHRDLLPALVEHSWCLIDQRDRRATRRVERQPESCSAREVDESSAAKALDDSGQNRPLATEDLGIGNRRRPRTDQIRFLVLRGARIVVTTHAVAQVRTHSPYAYKQWGSHASAQHSRLRAGARSHVCRPGLGTAGGDT